jgi:hypothetical protein
MLGKVRDRKRVNAIMRYEGWTQANYNNYQQYLNSKRWRRDYKLVFPFAK